MAKGKVVITMSRNDSGRSVWNHLQTEVIHEREIEDSGAGPTRLSLSNQLEYARWQEDLLERRSKQYDGSIRTMLVVSGLFATANAAMLALGLVDAFPQWPLAASIVATVLGTSVLMAASLVTTSSDEKRTPWQDSTRLTDPDHLVRAIDARALGIRNRMAYRRAQVYIGNLLTLAAGAFLLFYAIVVIIVVPIVSKAHSV